MANAPWRVGDRDLVKSGGEAVAVLHRLLELGRCDVTFVRSRDQSLQLVTNGGRAMLVLWGREGLDDGVFAVDSSVGDEPLGGFVLANGQVDSYAANETVPIDKAVEAVAYVIDHGKPDPRLEWCGWST